MKPLSAEVLRGLLRMYETAIAELCAMRDPTVDGLIDRMTHHRDEVLAALAGSQRSHAT
jgi:hypothetical protein